MTAVHPVQAARVWPLVLTAAARIYKAVKALGGENQEQHQQQPVPQRGSTTTANPTGPR
jgi:hypothetical protein